MMGKFRVGDKVRLTEQYGRHPIGTEGVVDDVVGGGDDDDLIYTDTVSGVYARRLELVPAVSAWQPKVGDRVRFTTITPSYCAKHTVADLTINRLDEDGRGGMNACVGGYPNESEDYDQIVRLSDIEPAITTLTITAGRYYKTRDGRKVGPAKEGVPGYIDKAYKWTLGNEYYVDDGRFYSDKTQHDNDLIAEWVDEPAVAAIANDNAAPAKFKVGDRVRGKNCLGSNVNGIITKVDIADDNLPYSVDGVWCRGEEIELITPATPTPTAIVALIEDGQPKPNTRPYVHATEEAATVEADRLASIHKGQQFGVYVLTTTSQEEKPTYEHEWKNLAAAGEKIQAIKALRGLTGMGLKPAKDAVEYFLAAA